MPGFSGISSREAVKLKKQIAVMGLLLLFIAGLFGCGKKTESSDVGKAASKDYVYKMQELDFFEEDQSFDRMVRSSSAIYAYCFNWDEDSQKSVLNFYELKEDGTLGETYGIPLDENESINGLQMDSQGNIYCIVDRYNAQETIDPETGEMTVLEENVEDDYFLTKMDLQGNEVYSVYLNEIPEFQKLAEENGYFYAGSILLDEGKGIYLRILGRIAGFDMEGNFVRMVTDGESELDEASFITLADGRIVTLSGNEEMFIGIVDMEKGEITEKYDLPTVSYDYSCYPGIGYDLYLVNSSGVYGYNLGDQDKTKLMDYIDSDISSYNIYNIMAINEREFYAMTDDIMVPARFTKVDPKDVKDKQQITLAMLYTDWTVRQEVVKFNKANENYRITIIDYNALYGSQEDYMAGANRLNTDIISGKMPDILLLESSMPVDSYISKGLLEDIKPHIEADEELDIHNFMPNIVEAFSSEGILYSVVPSFYIQTMIAKTSEVGSERGWTVQEAQELLASKPEGTMFMINSTRDYMLNSCMSMAGGQFIDWEKGVCSFDSDGFIQMLEFLKNFPEEMDEEMYTDEFYENYDAMWREGKVLTSIEGISDFRSYNYIEKGSYGEKVTLIGFPTSKGEGTVIYPTFQLAMSAKSGNKEGAWEFLRTFLTEDYQENSVNYNFPVSIKELDRRAQEAMRKPYYVDENGVKTEYDDTYYVGGVEIVIPPMTSQEADALKEQLYSFTEVYRYDENLINIISEEAAPFFAGQKSARDVASIIQSRAQIYMHENR